MPGDRKVKNKIIPQMYDVLPVNSKGDLDLEKINSLGRVRKNNFQAVSKINPVKTTARTFYDVRRLTPQEEEIKRFREFLLSEKKIPAKKKVIVRVLQNTNDIFAVNVKNEKAFLEKKLAKEREEQMVREREASRIYEQIKKQRELEARERETAQIYEQIQKQKELEAQKKEATRIREQIQKQKELEARENELFLRKAILERQRQKKAELRKRKRFEAKLARKLFVDRLQNRIVDLGKSIFNLLLAPFRLYLLFTARVATFFNSIVASLEGFSVVFTFPEKSYLAYQDRRIARKRIWPFLVSASCIFLLVFGLGFFYRSLRVKSLALENGKIAYASLSQAKEGIERRDFDGAISNFNVAFERFSAIQRDIDSLGSVIVNSAQYLPYLSKLSSGKHLSDAGKNISQIGALATDTMKTLDRIKNPLDGTEAFSYLKIFQDSDKNLTEIAFLVNELEGNLDKVSVEDIPEEKRTIFIELKKKLPEINKFVTSFAEEEKILADVLGGNGPRKYLFLFQNNQEMRATGGFIGTYAVLDIFEGNVKSFFVDGIFNPDGQLKEKVIPPVPIQKISATWSLHDSNWFPDFPVSAEKASWFYEKTGGPTVDGVITMTPTVMQSLLGITGPIDLPEYGVTIDKDNFLESVQQEVEVDYDKELNQPKKILADLAPKILDRVFNTRNVSDIVKTMDVLLASLNEKHILIYAKNYAVEKMLSANGWSGEVLDTEKDYLSVINTNINGYKTDGVIDETISHKAEIQADGSIIDTVTITRQHNGGNTPHDWWNRVNADYMRVYVPKGSRLIRASGQTNEFNSPPIDYHALGFKKDAQVGMEEASMIIDPESGTRVYEDSGKTVFANWVYVSPQESVTISYAYILPFKLDTNLTTNPADTYSLLVQKQSGSVGSKFSAKITCPNFFRAIWKYPSEGLTDFSTGEEGRRGFELASKLKTDKFIGLAFEKNNP